MWGRNEAGGVIPVAPQPEPPSFERRVRRRGLAWIRKKRLSLDGAVPEGVAIPDYWRECLGELHRAYRGICAYVCVYIEPIAGQPSVDHFVAKSRRLDQAYEWANYRLACSRMNSRKREFDDVLDPFSLASGTFQLEFGSGKIFPNPDLPPDARALAERTIERLGLDDAECRKLRVEYFTEYAGGHISEDYLHRRCPFVYEEADRQGLL